MAAVSLLAVFKYDGNPLPLLTNKCILFTSHFCIDSACVEPQQTRNQTVQLVAVTVSKCKKERVHSELTDANNNSPLPCVGPDEMASAHI